MKTIKLKNLRRARRQSRNRAKIFGTAGQPRLSVFRSNRYTAVQLINDLAGKTLVSASTQDLDSKKNKSEQARLLGEKIAEKAVKLGIKKLVFNKGAYKYHGRLKALAEGARAKGLTF